MAHFCKPSVSRSGYDPGVQLALVMSIDDGDCDMTIETLGIGLGAPLPARALVLTASEPASAGDAMTRWLAIAPAVGIASGLFGYDRGVISGALAGLCAGDVLSNHLGHRWATLLAGALVTFGAAVHGGAPGAGILVVGRFIVDVGVGVAVGATAINWGPADLVSRFFLWLVQTIGGSQALGLSAMFCGIGRGWI